MAASTAKSTRVLVDVHSGAVWASTSPVSVDGESWTRLMWQVQEQGIRWQTTVSNGGRAIEEAVSTVTPKPPHQRDVWHVLHLCQQVQARLDRQVEGLQQRTPVVARLAACQRPRGKCPKTDVAAHAAELSQVQYACEGLRYLSGELRQRLRVVVLTPQGIMPSAVRQGKLETVLILLDELSQTAPSDMQPELRKLVTRLGAALPQLVLFAPALDELQEQVAQALGPQVGLC